MGARERPTDPYDARAAARVRARASAYARERVRRKKGRAASDSRADEQPRRASAADAGDARSVSRGDVAPDVLVAARRAARDFDLGLRRGDLEGCVAGLEVALSGGRVGTDGAWTDAPATTTTSWVGARDAEDEDDDGGPRDGAMGIAASGARRDGTRTVAASSSSFGREVGRCLDAVHTTFVARCRDRGRLDLALRYAAILPPNTTLWSSLLGACARCRDYPSAVRAFAMYAANGLAPDAFAYSGLISAAGKAGDLAAANEALEAAVAEGACDDGVFNAHVDACARRGDYPRAAATVDMMRRLDVAPNVRTYNSLITAAGRAGDLASAKSALAALDGDARGLEATERTFGAALSAAAAATPVETENVTWALEVYRRASRAGAGGNNYAVSSLLTMLARGVAAGVWPADDAVTRAVGIVEFLVASSEETGATDDTRGSSRANGDASVPKALKKVPNAAVWSALMSVCARAGRAREALDALALMLDRGYPLEPYTLASALTACRASAEGGAPDDPAATSQVVTSLRQATEAREALEVFEAAPASASGTTAVRNAAMALYASVGRTDRAFALYEEMRAVDVRSSAPPSGSTSDDPFPSFGDHHAPDTITYNTLIAACVASGRFQRARELHRDMVGAGVARSARTYVSLIAAAAREKIVAGCPGESPAAAAEAFAAAEADVTVGRPNAFMYTALIDAQAKGGAADAAFDTFAKMKAAKVTPTVVTYGCLLNACRALPLVPGADDGDVDQSERAVERAYALLTEMTEAGVCPNDRCQNVLVRVVSEAGRIDEMLEEVKAIARRRGRFERATLEGVVRALCRASYPERALRILSWMDVRGYAPGSPTLRELTRVCASEGQVQWAWTLHQRMRRLGHRPDRSTCSALVMALCHAAMATDSGDARVMLRRAIEAYERAAAYGVATEGEGEVTMWDEDVDGIDAAIKPDDDDAPGRLGTLEEGHVASSLSSSSSFAPAEEVGGESEWCFASASGDWPLDDDHCANLDGPACPIGGEIAVAVEAKARRAKVPPNEVLSEPALRAIIVASARCGELAFARRLYRSAAARDALRPSHNMYGSGNAEDGGARAKVFEALVEACCHAGDVDGALDVFDDVKAYGIEINKVTLAFLESCCRRYNVPDYRVYDVCAQMRLQVSNNRERRLAVPLKTSSHHVRGDIDHGEDDANPKPDAGGIRTADARDAAASPSHASQAVTATRSAGKSGGSSGGAGFGGLDALKPVTRKGEDGEGGSQGARRRARERVRRESRGDDDADEPDLAWLKPGGLHDGGFDFYGEWHGEGRGDDDEGGEVDLIAAELRAHGLGRGGRANGDGRR